MTNLFRSLAVWWRRRRLQAAPPPCHSCGLSSTVDLQSDGGIPRWHCRCCGVTWWQDPKKDKKPVAYGNDPQPDPPDRSWRKDHQPS